MGGRLRTCIPAIYSRLSYTVGIKSLSELVTLAKAVLTPWLYHPSCVCAAVTLHHPLKCDGHSALKAVWNCIPKLNKLSRKSVLESILLCTAAFPFPCQAHRSSRHCTSLQVHLPPPVPPLLSPVPLGSLTQKPPGYPLGWQGRARQTWPEPDTILLLYGSLWRGVMSAGY